MNNRGGRQQEPQKNPMQGNMHAHIATGLDRSAAKIRRQLPDTAAVSRRDAVRLALARCSCGLESIIRKTKHEK